ncbi:hypothetical protein GCM10009558_085420 [Virgisporangium aurantiacum]
MYGTYVDDTLDEMVIVGTPNGLAGCVAETVELGDEASFAAFFETTLYEYVVPLATLVSNQRWVKSSDRLSLAGAIVPTNTLFR